MFIRKEEANQWTMDSNRWRMIPSIQAKILEAISQQLFHCEWYTPAGMDVTESDMDVIINYITAMEENGFKVTYHIFEKTSDFPNKRVKLHINWE